MQAGVGLLVSDVMPIYMIIPRYSRKYSLFYQLFNSNLFAHHIICYLERSLQRNHRPRVYFASYKYLIYYFPSYKFPIYYFAIFYFPTYKPKNPRIFTLSFVQFYLSLSDLTFASDREGIDNPFIVLGASCLIVCAGIGDLSVVSYWIDTLVL